MVTLVAGLKRLVVFARAFHQMAYAGLKIPLQQEWHFFQRITPGVGTLFAPLEAALRDESFPDMLGERR